MSVSIDFVVSINGQHVSKHGRLKYALEDISDLGLRGLTPDDEIKILVVEAVDEDDE